MKKGFTLIELLVSLALFAVVMTISVGTLLAIVDANRKAQSLRVAIDNVHLAMESMARNIRTGYNYSCGGGDCINQSSFSFVDDNDKPVSYGFVSGRIVRNYNNTGSIDLTAPEITIETLRFYVTGTNPNDTTQPTVTIVVKGRAGDANQGTDTHFNLETTVTQRILDY